jgi:hypothetical protein
LTLMQCQNIDDFRVKINLLNLCFFDKLAV